ELHDLDRSPLLAKKYDVKEYGTVIVESGGKVFKASGVDEQTVTNLLIRATRKSTMTIRFLGGHGEKDISDEGRSGYSAIAGRLKDVGHTVDSLNLISAGGVPKDTDLLIIVSPEADFSAEEYEMMSEYRGRGGKFLVLIDSPEQMVNFLASFGLKTSEFPVYDPINVAGTDPSTPLIKKYWENPVIGDFNLTTVFP
ncbi:MAG: Gldg family protein, partial [Nitrospiraceae bacterium]